MQCKRIMAETQRGTELTTVVLDGDGFSRQLVLASHTNEQWTSSPAGARTEGGRDGRVGEKSVGEVGDRRED